MSVELSIIIVNWNGGEILRSCLRSLAQAPPSVSYDIIVVDNASSDQSVAWLRSAELHTLLDGISVHIIQNSYNAGFSKANNQGIAYSRAPFLLLLNPDTEVTNGAIDTLINCLKSDERIGACGPRLLNTNNSLQPSAWRNPPSVWEIVVAGMGLWRLIPRDLRGELLLGSHWDHNRRRAVPMLFGAAILTKRKMIEEINGFDERFHMYGEDNEWCLRITRAGWLLIFEPDAAVVHHGGQLSRLRWDDNEKLRVKLKSSFDFQHRCLSRWQVIANLAAGCTVTTAQRFWRQLRREPAEAITITQEMYWTELKRAVKEKSR